MTGPRKRCNRVVAGVAQKRCIACKEWKPKTTEHFGAKGPYFRESCRPCYNAYMRGYLRARYVPRPKFIERRAAPDMDASGQVLAELWK